MFDLKKRLGWKPEPPDSRDLRLSIHPEFVRAAAKTPQKFSLRASQSPVRDQGDMNSCTGFALASLREYYEVLDQQQKNNGVQKEVTLDTLSPMFIYNYERQLEGAFDLDQGAYLRTGMKVLQKYGCLKESSLPYTHENLRKEPKASEESYKNCIYSYMRLYDINEIKTAISMFLPVVCGLSVYKNWDLPIVWNDGVIPEPSGTNLGGHAVLIVGYDDETEVLTYKNSWGTDWGDSGYFITSYDYIVHSGSSFWCGLKWR